MTEMPARLPQLPLGTWLGAFREALVHSSAHASVVPDSCQLPVGLCKESGMRVGVVTT